MLDYATLHALSLRPEVPIGFAIAYVVGTHVFQPASNPPRAPKPKGRKPLTASTIAIVLHNLLLAVYSGVTFVASFGVISEQFSSLPFHDAHCDSAGTRASSPHWDFIVWLFYMSKYYEVLDTIIIILKGRRPIVLQTFHHAGAVVLMWGLYRQANPMLWVFVVFNSFIHTLMYTYYALTAIGFAPQWKMLMTMLQLLQFLVGNSVTGYAYFSEKECINSERMVWLVLTHLYTTALIFLFSSFALATYCRKPSDGGKKQA